MSDESRQVGVFAKHWTPGRVKTRLARDIGAAAAAELARRFLETTLVRLEEVEVRRCLCFAPPERRDDFAALAGPPWRLEPQSRGDLGERMADYFQRSFAAGADRVLLIGADSPTLPLRRVADAFDALSAHDAVIGPAGDGGYYLIGARGRTPPLFDGIAWGEPDVAQRTRQLAARQRVRLAEIEPWQDVDDLTGLRRLEHELRDETSPALRQLQVRVAAALRSAGAAEADR